MVGMGAPCQEDEAEQGQNEVLFIVVDVVQYERSAFAEQIPPQRKDSRPGEGAYQIDPEKGAGGKIGDAEYYGENDSESIGEPGDERDIIPVLFDQLECLTELPGDEVEPFKQPPPFEAAEVEIELVSEERTCPGGANDAQNIQVSLKGEKTGQKQDRFSLQKRTCEQYPVSVQFQVLFDDLLNMHCQPL